MALLYSGFVKIVWKEGVVFENNSDKPQGLSERLFFEQFVGRDAEEIRDFDDHIQAGVIDAHLPVGNGTLIDAEFPAELFLREAAHFPELM